MTDGGEPEEDHETTLQRLSNEIGEPITVGGRVVYEEGDRHVIDGTAEPTTGPPPETDAQPGRSDLTTEVAAETPEDGPERDPVDDGNTAARAGDDRRADDSGVDPTNDDGLAPPVPDSSESGERRQDLKDGTDLEDASGQ
jgi:hypothetical protein